MIPPRPPEDVVPFPADRIRRLHPGGAGPQRRATGRPGMDMKHQTLFVALSGLALIAIGALLQFVGLTFEHLLGHDLSVSQTLVMAACWLVGALLCGIGTALLAFTALLHFSLTKRVRSQHAKQ